MSTDPSQTKAEIRVEFEMVLDFVTGEQARIATADQIERGLFVLLLSLGARLLLLFFQMRAQACSRDEITLADGQVLPYHSEQKRAYFSIFGIIPVWRPYFYETGVAGQTPLDAELRGCFKSPKGGVKKPTQSPNPGSSGRLERFSVIIGRLSAHSSTSKTRSKPGI